MGLKAFAKECKRVLKVTKKPNKAEYISIVRISSIGIAIIGLLGFTIHMIKVFITS